MKDENKHHVTVAESSLEQQFCKSEKLPLLCEKSRAILLMLVGLTAVWQSDEILVDLNSLQIALLRLSQNRFNDSIVLLLYSVTYAF